MGGEGPYIQFDPNLLDSWAKHTGLPKLDGEQLEAVYRRAQKYLLMKKNQLVSDGWGEVMDFDPQAVLFVLEKDEQTRYGGTLEVKIPTQMSFLFDPSQTGTWAKMFTASFDARRRDGELRIDPPSPLADIFYLMQIICPGLLLIIRMDEIDDYGEITRLQGPPSVDWVRENENWLADVFGRASYDEILKASKGERAYRVERDPYLYERESSPLDDLDYTACDKGSSPLKGQVPDFPNNAQQQQPPPSYGSVVNPQAGQSTRPHLQVHTSHPSGQPHPPAGSSYQHVMVPPTPHYPELDRQQTNSARKRFCEAFLFAILIYVLAAILFGSMFDRSARRNEWEDSQLDGVRDDLPTGTSVDRCVAAQKQVGFTSNITASSYPYPGAAHASFKFPVDSEALLLAARGGLSNGQVRITSGDGDADNDNAKVDVTIRYFHDEVLSNVKLCTIKRERGEVGLAILTPRWWPIRRREDNIYVDLHLSLPKSRNSGGLTIKRLETDLPNYSHHFSDLLQRVHFKNLILRSSNQVVLAKSLGVENAKITASNGGIDLENVQAQHLEAHTSNGPITGHYSSTGSLRLKTDNSVIRVNVDMTATGSSDGKVYLETSNGPVEANVKFHPFDKKTPGNFTFDAITTNGGLRLDVQDMPLDSQLEMNARTTNGLAHVWLPAPYEGSFVLETSNLTPQVNAAKKRDPWGKGRSRKVEQWRRNREMAGSVYWGEKKKAEKSTLTVSTSNAPVTLDL
ncbi:hypothetical protein V5O48_004305 [Marasmius crinis-equi]|uniref:DUF7330 domain-containing protein n=1 Tax=Marasmius crinis-equi TaxID=585013 RepID=A0ABR3FQH9_9AGAR